MFLFFYFKDQIILLCYLCYFKKKKYKKRIRVNKKRIVYDKAGMPKKRIYAPKKRSKYELSF